LGQNPREIGLGAPEREVSFTVPTGNFGDIFAGYLAKRIGLPIRDLVVATNQNDILDRCLRGQGYHKGETIPSISPSMDIQVSSNFERALFDAYDRDAGAIVQLMEELQTGGFEVSQGALETLQGHYKSGRASEQETSAEIGRTLAESAELLCPHSAVGVKVARAHLQADTPMITLATAHPAKFPDAVEEASGIRPPLPPRMADLYERSERVTKVKNDLDALKTHILDCIAT
jgi:threonine synthase